MENQKKEKKTKDEVRKVKNKKIPGATKRSKLSLLAEFETCFSKALKNSWSHLFRLVQNLALKFVREWGGCIAQWIAHSLPTQQLQVRISVSAFPSYFREIWKNNLDVAESS